MSLMLSDRELAALRADVLGLLPDTCVIQRATTTTNSAGAWTETYSAAGTVVCRLDPFKMATGEQVIAAQERGRAWYQLSVPWDADLRDGDRVTVSSVTYELVQVHDDHSHRLVRRAIVSKLGG